MQIRVFSSFFMIAGRLGILQGRRRRRKAQNSLVQGIIGGVVVEMTVVGFKEIDFGDVVVVYWVDDGKRVNVIKPIRLENKSGPSRT
jgi:hypothetical protein